MRNLKNWNIKLIYPFVHFFTDYQVHCVIARQKYSIQNNIFDFMKITRRRARAHIVLLFFCFHVYLAVIIFGLDTRLPGTPSSSFVSYIHFRFCLKVLEILESIWLITSTTLFICLKIYRNHMVFKQILTCTHVRTCWSDILGMENDYKVKLEKKWSNKLKHWRSWDYFILIQLKILHMLTYHPGHGSSMQSHKSFWFSMRIPSVSYIAAFPLS